MENQSINNKVNNIVIHVGLEICGGNRLATSINMFNAICLIKHVLNVGLYDMNIILLFLYHVSELKQQI